MKPMDIIRVLFSQIFKNDNFGQTSLVSTYTESYEDTGTWFPDCLDYSDATVQNLFSNVCVSSVTIFDELFWRENVKQVYSIVTDWLSTLDESERRKIK